MNEHVLDLNYGPWLPAKRDSKILDLGCGDGRILRFLAAKGYTFLFGVDRDASMLSAAGGIPGVTLECTEVDAQYLGNKKGCFDLIIVKQMIYYIDRGQSLQFMQALRDALTEDGVWIIEYFNASLISSRFTELKDPFIRTAYTEHPMRRLIAASGLHERATFGERMIYKNWRSSLYGAMRSIWFALLKGIYIIERGYDGEIPKIGQKSILSIAGSTPQKISARGLG